jgi:hypothetical protein
MERYENASEYYFRGGIVRTDKLNAALDCFDDLLREGKISDISQNLEAIQSSWWQRNTLATFVKLINTMLDFADKAGFGPFSSSASRRTITNMRQPLNNATNNMSTSEKTNETKNNGYFDTFRFLKR